MLTSVQFSSVQSLSHVCLFAIPWTAACQASLSIANSRSLPKLMSIELVMPSNHLILCRPLILCLQSLPASGSFPLSQPYTSDGQNIGTSASASILPMNIQGWFPLGLTGLVFLQSKGLSRIFSSTTKASVLLHSAFLMVQLSHPYKTTGETITLTRRTLSAKWCVCGWLSWPEGWRARRWG